MGGAHSNGVGGDSQGSVQRGHGDLKGGVALSVGGQVLFAVDELTGLIGAAILMRPSQSTLDLTTQSLKKKFKDKKFAAGCSRDVILQGAEILGWEPDYLMDETIKAMQEMEKNRV